MYTLFRLIHITQGGGPGGPEKCHQMSHGGRGSKKCHMLFEWPLCNDFIIIKQLLELNKFDCQKDNCVAQTRIQNP
jgi:hypothetical protein